MGRYTLVNNSKDVPCFTKVYLEEIDKFTTTIDEYDEEFMFNLRQIGIYSISCLHVYYRANKEKKVLDALNEEYAYLSKIKVKEGKINITDSIFQNKVREIIDILSSNDELFTAVQKSCSVSDKVKEYIERYIEARESFDYNKLLEHLSSYIQFRKLVVFIDQFLKLGYAPEEKTEKDFEDDFDILDFLPPIPPKR